MAAKGLALPLAVLALASAITIAGACATRRGGAVAPASSVRPHASPTATPSATPSPAASSAAASTESVVTSEGGAAEEVVMAPRSASPTPTPASLARRAVHGTASLVTDVVFAPFGFFWKALKENYSADHTDSSGAPVLGENASARERSFARVEATPKPPLAKRTLNAANTAYEATEKTIFLPWRILDDAIGVVFSPF